MPYRNALRDNWQRFQAANDAEMRMYAQQRMAQMPRGMYAAAEAEALSMDDIGYDAQGNLVILSREPTVYNQDTRTPMPQMPEGMGQGMGEMRQGMNEVQQGVNSIQRRREELARALEEY